MVAKLKAVVQRHVEEEEGELFPSLEDALDEEELEEMGQAVMKKNAVSEHRESIAEDRTNARGSSPSGRRTAQKKSDTRGRKTS
jgi:hypothetical protein